MPHRSQPQIPAPLFPPAPKIPFATGVSDTWLASSPKPIEIIEKYTHSCILLFFSSKYLSFLDLGCLRVAFQGSEGKFGCFPLKVGVTDNLELLLGCINTERGIFAPRFSTSSCLAGWRNIQPSQASIKINVWKKKKSQTWRNSTCPFIFKM